MEKKHNLSFFIDIHVPCIRIKICCLFENFAVCTFTVYVLHSAEKFSNEQQILGLNFMYGSTLLPPSIFFDPSFLIHSDINKGFGIGQQSFYIQLHFLAWYKFQKGWSLNGYT